MLSKAELLSKLATYLEDRGISKGEEHLDPKERLVKYGLPSLEATKGILQDLFSYKAPNGSNPIRKIKNKIIKLISNVTISTIELPFIKQNKFNELTYQFIELIVQENQELKDRVEKLETSLKSASKL